MKVNKMLVFSEDRAVLYSLCTGAEKMARKAGAILLGKKEEAEAAASYVSEVFWMGEKEEGSMVEDYVTAAAEVIHAEKPEVVLIGSSRRGKCFAGRLAVQTGGYVITDPTSLKVSESGQLEGTRMIYGGAARMSSHAKSGLMIVLLGSGMFEAEALERAGTIHILEGKPVKNGLRVISSRKKTEERVNLAAARYIVGVGRGVGSKENIAHAEALAEKINGELACSRPVAEGENWMAKNRYIGVSGVTVKPEVYFACGISGQVQHMVGVNEAGTIIAVNKDKNAAIFKHCDLGIVGDMNQILPKMTKML